MSEHSSRFWKVIKWAAVAAYLLLPVMAGWLSSSHVECSYCLGDNLRHSLAIFGYMLLGGFAVSYTQPSRPSTADTAPARLPSINYREDLQEISFWVSLAMTVFFFMVGFNWELFWL